jgi:subtilase family serine protease
LNCIHGLAFFRARRLPHRRKRNRPLLNAELLEPRSLLSTGFVAPSIEPASAHAGITSTPGPAGFSPGQLRVAYGLDITSSSGQNSTRVTFAKNGSSVVGDGSGQTIAIVDAYSDPRITSDLAAFSSKFGLPQLDGAGGDPRFKIESQYGSTSSLPSPDTSWGEEISLDVEWAHAIAPRANILLVEAYSAGTNDLLTAIDTARTAAGVSVVSMSWGGGEFSSEAFFDSHFTTPPGHGGVTFVASSGDDGSSSPEWPAASPNVVSVGGTTLSTTSNGTWLNETAWSGSVGGTSLFESRPSYQSSVRIVGTRAVPDVAFNADPNTGVSVYDTFGDSGWVQIGGTSAGAPQWAGIIAIANQGRAFAGNPALDGVKNTLPLLYGVAGTSAYANDFHDVTSGSNSSGLGASTGFDLVTGLGTPVIANASGGGLVSLLVGTSTPTPTLTPTPTPTPTPKPKPPTHHYPWWWYWSSGYGRSFAEVASPGTGTQSSPAPTVIGLQPPVTVWVLNEALDTSTPVVGVSVFDGVPARRHSWW